MHITFAVFFLLIAHVISYPSLRNIATDGDEILSHLENEHIERSVTSDEDDSNEYEKRQGGYNIIKPDLKCEIECVGNLRNPSSGPGLSIKEAANACKNICANTHKKREQKRTMGQQNEQTHDKSLREFSNYLMKQLQLNDNE